jgi:hypothetical protein
MSAYIRCIASLTDRDYRRSHSTFCDDFGGRIAPFTITREALSTKLRLFHGDGSEILPAYFSNNYVALLLDEEQSITMDLPSTADSRNLIRHLRGWNIPATSANITENTAAAR